MIGFYDYTLILTLLGLVSSVFGMIQAANGHIRLALLCLIVSGICDGFDGMVARTKKNRTTDEKSFGIQLDSLCDMVAFGAFPAMLCYHLGVRGPLGVLAISLYCICSVIRLSYYNVKELNRLFSEQPGDKYYYGLPITSITVILPVFFSLRLVLSERAFAVVLSVLLIVVAICFILNFRMRSPKKLLPLAIPALAIFLFCEVFFLSRSGEAPMTLGEAWKTMLDTFRAIG